MNCLAVLFHLSCVRSVFLTISLLRAQFESNRHSVIARQGFHLLTLIHFNEFLYTCFSLFAAFFHHIFTQEKEQKLRRKSATFFSPLICWKFVCISLFQARFANYICCRDTHTYHKYLNIDAIFKASPRFTKCMLQPLFTTNCFECDKHIKRAITSQTFQAFRLFVCRSFMHKFDRKLCMICVYKLKFSIEILQSIDISL